MDRIRYLIYWNIKENYPKIITNDESSFYNKKNEYKYIATDLKPVFNNEKILLILLFPELTEDIFKKSVWKNKKSSYIIDGSVFRKSILKKVKEIKNINEFRLEVNKYKVDEKYDLFEKQNLQKFIAGNTKHLQNLLYLKNKDTEDEYIGAEPYIIDIVSKYNKRDVFVSFSGGKDSIVVSHLVRKALNNQSICHLFGDTTLEFDHTIDYINDFTSDNRLIPIIKEKNIDSDFMDICNQIGPPSRVKSWCCSVFKTGPIGTTLSEWDKNVLTFYGIRRSESAARSKYKKTTQSPKIKKQIVASPVIDWLDIDIWLYILSEKLPINKAYKEGFSRVGCWCCPNNSDWSDFLTSVYMPEKHEKWKSYLIDFSKKIGKPDPEVYVADGKWKARHGGAGLDTSNTVIQSKDCAAERNSKNYDLTKKIDNSFYELFKPFGNIDTTSGKKILGEIIIRDRKNNELFKISGKVGSSKIKITIREQKNNIDLFRLIEKQLVKFQTCISCSACNSSCPVGAIKVLKGSYYIDEKKCTNCLKCVSHFNKGCLVASALGVKKTG